MELAVKTISLQESFDCIEQEKSLIILFTKKGMKIAPTMEQICEIVEQHNSLVPIFRVEIDDTTLTREYAHRLSLMRVPQLRFYAKNALLGTLTGSISPSEVYQKILTLYTNN